MSLYESIGTQPKQPNFQQALSHLRGDPAGTLKAAGLNIPDGMSDPQQIVNHLLQSGQVPQNRLTMAMRMMGMGRR